MKRGDQLNVMNRQHGNLLFFPAGEEIIRFRTNARLCFLQGGDSPAARRA
jgi:hypothetical protein